ncbi:acidic leucine-rich nuclear phosphoprotein 32 family member B-like [Lingula anatina]|uniref:Acidic leucine-rich nuclear phosphoprotein 32 family member B-like n=1 Tax=Lingula anatina TaxID=7574 RepID=A0A1S3ILX2_LINAN|nr:acidic leucine-rich nuclear phosphoprotein 32 family member B-like [Lingula anatina]|eukprot:XP_013398896.1 acidic leucine-rich nuclear phosphoprotein 32 family member B-like [Lingula anatina]
MSVTLIEAPKGLLIIGQQLQRRDAEDVEGQEDEDQDVEDQEDDDQEDEGQGDEDQDDQGENWGPDKMFAELDIDGRRDAEDVEGQEDEDQDVEDQEDDDQEDEGQGDEDQDDQGENWGPDKMFAELDIDGDGYISLDELSTVLQGYPDINAAFKEMDANDDGKIDRQEFDSDLQ